MDHNTTPILRTQPSIQEKPDHRSFLQIIRSSLPVLTRFHAGYFRISLSLCSQALLWKSLRHAADDSHPFRRIFRLIPPTAFTVLWFIALFALSLLSVLYLLRCLFRFDLVKAEFRDHVGVNYLFTPWISWLLLLQSSSYIAPSTPLYHVLWWIFVVPVLILDVTLYGQWFTKGKRFLSTMANPTIQLSVIGNLVGAEAAAMMRWNECALYMFSIGMAHYLVLFVTLYQRLTGTSSLPTMLRPVFFLFFAVPSLASLAWESITGKFDTTAKMMFFLSVFFFMSLVSRPRMFKKSMRKFSIAWWAYSFPLTVIALASAKYAEEVKGSVAHVMMMVLSAVSVLVCFSLVLLSCRNYHLFFPQSDRFETKTQPGSQTQ